MPLMQELSTQMNPSIKRLLYVLVSFYSLQVLNIQSARHVADFSSVDEHLIRAYSGVPGGRKPEEELTAAPEASSY